MNTLCFNTMDRSAYLLGDEDPNLPAQIRAAARAGGHSPHHSSPSCRSGEAGCDRRREQSGEGVFGPPKYK